MEWERPVGDSVEEALAYEAATETLYVGTRSGLVLAVDAATGENRWLHDAVGEVSSAPAFDDSRVYVGFREPGGAVALDKATGRLLWRTVAVGWVARDPVVSHNTVLFVSDANLLALSPRTGERLATYELSVPDGAELNNLNLWGDGLIASYLGRAGAGVVIVPRVRNTRSVSYSLDHEVVDLRITADEGVLVHGPAGTGDGTVLTVVEGVEQPERSDDAPVVVDRFRSGSRLLGVVHERLLMSTVPPAVTSFSSVSPEGLTEVWRTLRYHPGERAQRWAPSGLRPAGLQVSGSVAVSGRGVEGIVGYDPATGEILYHFELEEGVVVRGFAAGPERLYLLLSTATGGRATLVALSTPGR